MLEFGKFEYRDPRTIWADEARDFTPWLASSEHLLELGTMLGMKLEL